MSSLEISAVFQIIDALDSDAKMEVVRHLVQDWTLEKVYYKLNSVRKEEISGRAISFLKQEFPFLKNVEVVEFEVQGLHPFYFTLHVNKRRYGIGPDLMGEFVTYYEEHDPEIEAWLETESREIYQKMWNFFKTIK